MPIPSTIDDLSASAGSNSPAGSDPPTEGDNYLRSIQAIIRQEYERLDFLSVRPDAVGDGTTSDVAAISAADAVGQMVRVPPGTYLIDSNTTLTGVYSFDVGAVFKIATGVTLLFTQPATERWASPRQIFQCVGTGKVQWQDCSPTVYPEWWTTNTTPGTTDMLAALQAAADCVVNGADAYCPGKTTGGAGRCKLVLKTKKYRTTAVWDCNQRDYLQIVADGKAIIQSESTTYIADFSSTYRLDVRDVEFQTFTAAVGLLFNRCTSNPYCLYANFQNVTLYVDTDTAANGGQGTYGVVNCRAEQNVWANCDVRADVPLYMTQTQNGSFPPVSGTQDTTIVSLAVGTFNQCNFLRHTKHNYAAILDQVIDVQFLNCYWGTLSSATGSNPYAVFSDTLSGCRFTGLMEGTARFMFVSKTCYSLDIDITPQIASIDAGGLVNFDSANNTGLVDSRVKFNIASAVSGGKVLRWGGGGPSLQLFNVQIYTAAAALIEAASISATNASVAGIDVYSSQTTPPTVLSAATLTLAIGTRIAIISGTTTITSLTALGFADREVLLIFQGALTLTDGSNLNLAGNFVTTAGDTIKLACDGTNWYEVCRSVN